MHQTKYVFQETPHQAELGRLRLLEAVFDPKTQAALLAAGLRPGMRCLEVGAGAGSVARWMSQVVGANGLVAAVDINTRFLEESRGPHLEVYEADIQSVPLKPASFDVIHARFVFIHLPNWRAALDATVRLLKPGGRLVLEEPDFSVSRALTGPLELRRAFEHVHEAICEMFGQRQMDYAFGLRLPAIAQEFGLAQLTVENDVPIAPGGSPLARMLKMSTTQLQDKYLATGKAAPSDIAGYGAFASDPANWAIYHGTVRVTSTRPSST